MSLSNKDLEGVIYPDISLDEFVPKSGNTQEAIVIAFYAMDQLPAKDLNTFIQRGSFNILDSDVSPNVDTEGRYIVFVEVERNRDFPKLFADFVRDIENVTGPYDWKVKPYLSDNAFEIGDPELYKFVILDPGSYVEKKNFDEVKVKEATHKNIESFLENSLLQNVNLTEAEGYVIFNNNVAAKIVDFGPIVTTLDRCNISESALTLFDVPDEVLALRSMLGDSWEVEKMDNTVVLNHTDKILVLTEPEFIYA